MNKKHDILIVDDIPANLILLKKCIESEGYSVRSATSGNMALKSTIAKHPDLILLDIKMPNMNGFEVCSRLKADKNTKDIPIIFISALDDTSDKVNAFLAGGVDYITKPFSNEEVIARVSLHLELNDYRHHLEEKIDFGIKEIKELNTELDLTQKEVMLMMGAIGEERSNETGLHVVRVAEYSYLLATLYGLDEEKCNMIKRTAPMHDIGKVAIADNILHKPAALNDDEWEIMKTHSAKGHSIFKSSTRPLLKMASIIAYEHHERWDGSGYPNSLKGEEIDIVARIVTVADVFDALSHDRCYKKAWPIEKTLQFLEDNSEKIFDPVLVKHFLENTEKFLKVRDTLQDH